MGHDSTKIKALTKPSSFKLINNVTNIIHVIV